MNCRTCDSERLEMFLDLGNQPHCDNFLTEEQVGKEKSYPLQVCFCHDCTTVQINYTVPKEVMFTNFLYLSGTTKTLRNHFQDSANRFTEAFHLQPYDLVVDIGSNDGTWLSCYRKDLRVLGIDPAENIAKIANNAGIETWAKFFDVNVAREIVEKKGKAQLITAAGVFFHLEELHSVTEGVRELLDTNGTFCIQAIYLGGMIKNTAFDQIYHEHLTYWTVRSLSRLLDRHGLEIYKVSLKPIHGGSLEVLVSHKHIRKTIDPSVQEFLRQESEAGLDKIETYYKFADRVWSIQEELVNILISYKMAERTVHAYGAPAKGTTLLNSFGIDTKLVDCAVEVSPLKVGKYIPGCKIPIYDETLTPEAPAYLLLAWNFLGEFLTKKQKYLENGGEFIVPVPTPTIINKSNWGSFK